MTPLSVRIIYALHVPDTHIIIQVPVYMYYFPFILIMTLLSAIERLHYASYHIMITYIYICMTVQFPHLHVVKSRDKVDVFSKDKCCMLHNTQCLQTTLENSTTEQLVHCIYVASYTWTSYKATRSYTLTVK